MESFKISFIYNWKCHVQYFFWSKQSWKAWYMAVTMYMMSDDCRASHEFCFGSLVFGLVISQAKCQAAISEPTASPAVIIYPV